MSSMKMESLVSLSRCGRFIAIAQNERIRIERLSQESSTRPDDNIAYDLRRIFSEHQRTNSFPISAGDISVRIMEWEHVETGPSTKLAVYASHGTLHLILVFILGDSTPILIEADSWGIERLRWIPSKLTADCAYKNSTVLIAFTRNFLDMKVYSLACTQMLFTIPKPLLGDIILRPQHPNIWSVVVNAYYEKNSPQRLLMHGQDILEPVLLHFYTDGIQCSLFASLRLKINPSTSASFTWSDSGKWLHYFDAGQYLDSYHMAVFNIFAFHDKRIESLSQHVAQPTTTSTVKIDLRETPNLGLHPISTWGLIGETDYILILPTKVDSILRVEFYDVSSLYSAQKQDISLNSGDLWTISRPDTKYKKLAKVPFHQNSQWKEVVSNGCDHLLVTDKCATLIRAITYDKGLKFEAVTSFFTSSTFFGAEFIRDHSEIIVLFFNDHVSVYNGTAIDVVTTSPFKFVKASVSEVKGYLHISLVEETPKGLTWSQVEYEIRSDVQTGGSSPRSDKRYGANKTWNKNENDRLDRLLTEIKTRHLPSSSSQAEDITDTFQVHKRRRNM